MGLKPHCVVGILTGIGKSQPRDTGKNSMLPMRAEIGVICLDPVTRRITVSHQRLGERHEISSQSEPPEVTNLVNTSVLDFKILASEILREPIPVVLSHLVCSTLPL